MSYTPSNFHPGPCPVCGKPGGAFMGKSTWSWGGMACSDSCGEAASAAVDQVCSSAPYQVALKQLLQAKETMARLKSDAVAELRK